MCGWVWGADPAPKSCLGVAVASLTATHALCVCVSVCVCPQDCDGKSLLSAVSSKGLDH